MIGLSDLIASSIERFRKSNSPRFTSSKGNSPCSRLEACRRLSQQGLLRSVS
jgi:hypothetical protein